MSGDKTSQRAAAIASKALQDPKSLTSEEVQTLAASVLSQSSNQGQQGQQKGQSQQFQGQPQGQQKK
jgi:hypothetical protein